MLHYNDADTDTLMFFHFIMPSLFRHNKVKLKHFLAEKKLDLNET